MNSVLVFIARKKRFLVKNCQSPISKKVKIWIKSAFDNKLRYYHPYSFFKGTFCLFVCLFVFNLFFIFFNYKKCRDGGVGQKIYKIHFEASQDAQK